MSQELKLIRHPDTGEIIPEEWRDISGYEGLYQVSNYGRVKSIPRTVDTKRGKRTYQEKILSPGLNDNGYEIVALSGKTKKVHRLVAKAFIPNPENKRTVNHKDDDKLNNKKLNLEWSTHRENNLHAHKSKYPGTSWDEGRKKWGAYVKIGDKRKLIGRYESPEEANQAYINYLIEQGLSTNYAQVA